MTEETPLKTTVEEPWEFNLDVELEKIKLERGDFLVLRLNEKLDNLHIRLVAQQLNQSLKPYQNLEVHAVILTKDMELSKVDEATMDKAGWVRKEDNTEISLAAVTESLKKANQESKEIVKEI